ncbi:hypothetical protein [Maribacter sp. 2307UL18-2]|uniref:hypothetical protein n=1 Tax=Maribacter sp. 2307UL18-2 TaxID=3386274 RepID=UPI0039BCBAEA
MNKPMRATAKALLLSGVLAFTFSCDKDNEDNPIDLNQKVTTTEVQTILETDEFSSAADGVITDIFDQGSAKYSSKNEDCYATTFTDTGFTVTFDNCTVEEGEEELNGVLTVTYKEGEESTAFMATYTDLSVGEYVINGTRSFTMNGNGENENVSFTIVSDMSIKLADGSVIEEAGTKTFAILFDFENFANSALTIAGDWTVKADGQTYTVRVSSDLIANFGCEYVGKGVMALAKNGLEVVIDFGDGTCDEMADMTYPDGTKEEISLKD